MGKIVCRVNAPKKIEILIKTSLFLLTSKCMQKNCEVKVRISMQFLNLHLSFLQHLEGPFLIAISP